MRPLPQLSSACSRRLRYTPQGTHPNSPEQNQHRRGPCRLLEELMEVVIEQLGRVVDTRNCFVALYNPDTDSYTKPVERDINGQERAPGEQVDLRGGLTDYVRKSGKPLLLTDQNRKELVEIESIKPLGTRAECWLGIPLRVRDEVCGVVVFQSYDNPTLFTERDVELLSIVAGSLGRTIERQRANAELREREARLRVLTERMPALIWTQNLDGTI
ncbi:MAG: GAF domain-containing protein, partial [bacterium]|nr:GAF domain-containing protein [bacterium]